MRFMSGYRSIIAMSSCRRLAATRMVGRLRALSRRRAGSAAASGRSIPAVFLGAMMAAGLLGTACANASESLPGPVPAEVVRVVDGDTIEVRARIWLGQQVTTLVRLAGIDTPELHGGCAESQVLALEARQRLAALVASHHVTLQEVRYDAHGGRVVARVRTEDGADLAEPLLAAGLARPYTGHGPRPDWCSVAARPHR